jgi:hypothetical protein
LVVVTSIEGHRQGQNAADAQAAQTVRPSLSVVTGVPDDHRGTLEPDHVLYGLFEQIWRNQDQWTLAEHRSWWAATLHLWPARRGGGGVSERLAHAFANAQRRGAAKETAAVALGYQLPDLERMIRRTRDRDPDYAARALEQHAVITDYVLPRVYADGEDVPCAGAYPNHAPAPADGERTAQLQAALDALVPRRPR